MGIETSWFPQQPLMTKFGGQSGNVMQKLASKFSTHLESFEGSQNNTDIAQTTTPLNHNQGANLLDELEKSSIVTAEDVGASESKNYQINVGSFGIEVAPTNHGWKNSFVNHSPDVLAASKLAHGGIYHAW